MQSSNIKGDWAAALVIGAAKLLTAYYMVIVQSRLRKRLKMSLVEHVEMNNNSRQA